MVLSGGVRVCQWVRGWGGRWGGGGGGGRIGWRLVMGDDGWRGGVWAGRDGGGGHVGSGAFKRLGAGVECTCGTRNSHHPFMCSLSSKAMYSACVCGVQPKAPPLSSTYSHECTGVVFSDKGGQRTQTKADTDTVITNALEKSIGLTSVCINHLQSTLPLSPTLSLCLPPCSENDRGPVPVRLTYLQEGGWGRSTLGEAQLGTSRW